MSCDLQPQLFFPLEKNIVGLTPKMSEKVSTILEGFKNARKSNRVAGPANKTVGDAEVSHTLPYF